MVRHTNVCTGATTDYITMGDHTVGRFLQNGAFFWLHEDHLGSGTVGTNAAGAVMNTVSFLPFGEPMTQPPGLRDQPAFTGHIWDYDTQLIYAQARFYDPVTARFLAPDPVGFADGGAGYFNRYAYTMIDPVNLVDPAGTHPTSPFQFFRFRFGGEEGAGRAQAAMARGAVPNGDAAVFDMPEDQRMRSSEILSGLGVAGAEAWANGIANTVVVAATALGPADEAAAAVAATKGAGIVYRRTDRNTGRCYIGRCNSEELYTRRQRDHQRQNPEADYAFEIIDNAEPGQALREAEQRQITAHGGADESIQPQWRNRKQAQ